MGPSCRRYNTIFPSDASTNTAFVTSMAVSLSLFCVIIFASMFGAMVPIVLEKLKIDPALATGPFIQVTNDIVGMSIYMVISTHLMKALL